MSHSDTQCKSFICQIRHGIYSLQKKSAGCKVTKYLWGLLWGCIFFFLKHKFISQRTCLFFLFLLKHIYFLWEIHRGKKKVRIREACNKPGFYHQLCNIMIILDGYNILWFRNPVNVFSQCVWGKCSCQEVVSIYRFLLCFVVWVGFVLTGSRGKCCAIQARAEGLIGDFCIFLITEREDRSL